MCCVQVIVPKRTALLLDRIMTALQKAVEDEKGGHSFASNVSENKASICMARLCHVRTVQKPGLFSKRLYHSLVH
jgi:hypothetical protein